MSMSMPQKRKLKKKIYISKIPSLKFILFDLNLMTTNVADYVTAQNCDCTQPKFSKKATF